MAPSATSTKGKSKAAPSSSAPAAGAAPARKTRSSASSAAASPVAKAKEPKPTPAAKKSADKALDAKAAPKARLPAPQQARQSAAKVAKQAQKEKPVVADKTKKATAPAAKGADKKGAEKKEAPAPPKAGKRAREEEEKPEKAVKKTAAASKEKAKPAAPVSILKKPKVAAAAAVPEPEEAESDEEEEEEDADDGPLLRGLSVSGSEDGANSSDEDEEDDKAMPEAETVRLPSSRNDKDVKARLDQVAKKRKAGGEAPTPSVLYFGRLPKSFIEPALRSYLTQFGDVLRLRLSRNKRTGASKHYAFVEFADADVARIVRETMDGYLIDGRLMQVRDVPAEKVHPTLWVGAGASWRKVPKDRVARMQHDKPKSAEARTKVEDKLLARQEKRRGAIKAAGIDYEFDGYSR